MYITGTDIYLDNDVCHSRLVINTVTCLGATIFSLYIVYDTQLIVEENVEHTDRQDDIVLAATSLYLDVINLFLFYLI